MNNEKNLYSLVKIIDESIILFTVSMCVDLVIEGWEEVK